MNKFFRMVIAFFALSFGGAAAQTQVFYADDLARAPSGIAVSPGYLTVLEFYQEVDQVASGRPGMMKVEVNGAKIYVSALVQSGSTDLIVEVGSRTQLFRVTVMKGNAPRRYVVVLQKPASKTPPAEAVRPTPAPQPVPASSPAPATKPVIAPPAPQPQSLTTVSASSVVGLNDPSARNAAVSNSIPSSTKPSGTGSNRPITVPRTPAARAPTSSGAATARLVYADFERQQGLRPISALGGSATISSFEQNPAARTLIPDATAGGPALLLDAEGSQTQRAFFEYQTFAPNEWAGASLDIDALPLKNERKQALDVSAYDTLTLELSATGIRNLQIELRSRDNGIQTNSGEFPQVQLPVTSTPRQYRIPLSSFRAPSWVKSPVNVKDVLKRLTELSVKVVTATPSRGRVTVDNVTFERSAPVTTQTAKPASGSRSIPTTAKPATKPVALSTAASTPMDNPASLEFGVLRQVSGTRPGELAIYYAVKNTGTKAVNLRANQLKLSQSGRDLTGGLRLDVTSVSLRPGQAHLGTIIVRDAKPGNLSLRWLADEVGTGRSYVLQRSLLVQLL